jgi:hypothetical protein
MFQNSSYLSTFLFEHAPHRQGLGFVIDRIILNYTNWNTKIESFHILSIYFISFFYAFKIKLKYSNCYSPLDVLICLVFLGIGHYETTLIVPNPSHGAYSILFIILTAYAILQKSLKNLNLLFLFFLFNSLYSGFAFFLGPLIWILYLSVFVRDLLLKRAFINSLTSILIISLMISVYFIDYKFSPASSCFKFPHDHPLDYLLYMGYQYSSLLSFKGSFLIGILYLFILISIFLIFFNKYINSINYNKLQMVSKDYVILIFITFPLIFSVFNAVGRVCTGLSSAQASKYYPYISLSIFGIYLNYIYSFNWREKIFGYYFIVLLILLLIKTEWYRKDEFIILANYQKLKQDWSICIEKKKDVNYCTSNYRIYPHAAPIMEKIKILKEKNLNFYNTF